MTEVSDGDRSIRVKEVMNQRATEVSEGDRSIRGRQLKKYQRCKGGGGGDSEYSWECAVDKI